MSILDHYYILNKSFYEKDGFSTSGGEHFLDTLERWEHGFYINRKCYANHMMANEATMKHLRGYCGLDNEYRLGMDMVDGDADLDANMAAEEFSQHKTVYAIGSRLAANEDEPIWLLINDSLEDDKVVFYYIPDDDDEEESPENTPTPERERQGV